MLLEKKYLVVYHYLRNFNTLLYIIMFHFLFLTIKYLKIWEF